MLIEASQRLASPAQVSLSYHSEDGHESMSISQSAELHGRSPYEDVTTGENWQEVNRAGTTVRATKPGARQAQAHVARDGTFALLVSDSLAVDELVAIAARLQPARGSRSVP
jgi:hypothetical protein